MHHIVCDRLCVCACHRNKFSKAERMKESDREREIERTIWPYASYCLWPRVCVCACHRNLFIKGSVSERQRVRKRVKERERDREDFMTRCIILFVTVCVCVLVTEIYSVRGRYNGIYIHEIQLLTTVSLYNNLVQGRGTPLYTAYITYASAVRHFWIKMMVVVVVVLYS